MHTQIHLHGPALEAHKVNPQILERNARALIRYSIMRIEKSLQQRGENDDEGDEEGDMRAPLPVFQVC